MVEIRRNAAMAKLAKRRHRRRALPFGLDPDEVRMMTIPVTVALAFAAWTLVTLFASVGVYRWSRVLSGQARLTDFPADRPEGADWYRRAMRAHANCVENLSIYVAIVVAIIATGVSMPALDVLAIALLAARIAQTLIHIIAAETNATVAVRFTFFLVQVLCMATMMAILVASAY
jgi:uncharacterized MAPEG superfamily protein